MTTFLAGLDGSEGARRAALYAARKARVENARLLLVHIVEPGPFPMILPEQLPPPLAEEHDESEWAVSHLLQPLKETLAAEGLEVEILVSPGHPASRLAELARECGVDQIFVGRQGRSRIASLIFGSVSRELVRSCPIPITVVPYESVLEEPTPSSSEIEGSRIQ